MIKKFEEYNLSMMRIGQVWHLSGYGDYLVISMTISDGYIRTIEITPLKLNEGNEK